LKKQVRLFLETHYRDRSFWNTVHHRTCLRIQHEGQGGGQLAHLISLVDMGIPWEGIWRRWCGKVRGQPAALLVGRSRG
jgi:hypothetical protein